jgi:hypothetical protein
MRFKEADVAAWQRDGGVLIERFFTPKEVQAVHDDFVTVFDRQAGADEALEKKAPGEIGRFNPAQFSTFAAIPFDCSPALNLIGVHPELIRFARAALETDHIHLYQCQAWAKFTGDADYDQPLHTDFANHTLTVPSEDARDNSITILCYFTDVSEAHGPMHYVRRSDSEPLVGPEAMFSGDPDLQQKLAPLEKSSASPAGSIFPYSIDVYHRGTNLTSPGGYRFAVMACFKRADNDAIGYHAWPYHHTQPWTNVFEHATPDQLSCFGVHPPGHPFWTPVTLDRAAVRYPGWDLTPYREAMVA